MKQRKKNHDKKKKVYSLFEIFTLILSIISVSFIIGCITGDIANVSAAGIRCCMETNDGDMCQEFGTGDCDSQCKDSCVPTECALLPDCSVGCCFDKVEGHCSANSMMAQCLADGGAWSADASCEVPECQKGCCVLGEDSQYVTKTRCDRLSELHGVVSEFRKDVDELTCYQQSGKSEVGACITSVDYEGIASCKFTTREDCLEITGDTRDFKKDYLCAHEELKTNCERQKTTGCLDGQDEVYWFDSCGNRENIYSSNKQQSWNNGKVLDKLQSCNPTSSNVNSPTCGNCNYELGAVCRSYRNDTNDVKPVEGNYICRDLNCYDAPMMGGETQDRINGESWCVYDGPIGIGLNPASLVGGWADPLVARDLVGSRHFRYMCINGEVEVEPCADYRQQICVQDTKTLDNGEKIDEAMCRVNMWEDCYTKNTESGCDEACAVACGMNPDCFVKHIKLAKDFEFSMCLPAYPPGFDFSPAFSGLTENLGSEQVGTSEIGLDGVESYESQVENVGGHICSLGSQTCTYTEVKEVDLGWKCIHNCGCKDNQNANAQVMNDLCVSLGDCGIYSNYKGATTLGGFYITGDGADKNIAGMLFNVISTGIINNLGRWASENTKLGGRATAAKPGFFKKIEDIDKIPIRGIMQVFGYGVGGTDPYQGGDDGFLGMFTGPTATESFMVAGAAGAAGAGSALATGAGAAAVTTSISAIGTSGGVLLTAGSTFTATTTSAVLVGSEVVTLAAGESISLASGGVLQSGAGSLSAPGGAAIGTIVIWAVVAVIVAIIVMNLLGIGDTRELEVKYTCMPWMQPIALQSNCEACNEDPFKPCSKYRCESLGVSCMMVNEKSEEYGACVSKKTEDTIPMIEPWQDILNKSLYSYTDISTNGFGIRDAKGEYIPL